MKRAFTSAAIMTTLLFSAAIAWAGGMGGGMGGGMMGGGGHMMDSYGNGQMGSGRYYDQDRTQRQREARQRAQEAFNRDMRQLDRQIRQKERTLDAETQKKSPDQTKVDRLHRELTDLERQQHDRQIEFENRWARSDQ